MTNANWTVETMLARKATGDALVTHGGWSISYETGSGITGARLSLRKYPPCSMHMVPSETDPRDGSIFPSVDAAQCYALNRGALIWFRDWKALRAQGLV